MKLGYLGALAALLLAPTLSIGGDYSGAAGKTITVEIPDATAIDVAVPAGWSVDRLQSDPSRPPAIRIRPKGSAADLQITFFPDRFGNLNTRPKIDAAAKRASLQYVGGSVEKELRLKDLKSMCGTGAIAEFTDARYATMQPVPGQFKIVGSGLLHLGQSVASFTLMGQSLDDPAYVTAKEVLLTGLAPHNRPTAASSKTLRR